AVPAPHLLAVLSVNRNHCALTQALPRESWHVVQPVSCLSDVYAGVYVRHRPVAQLPSIKTSLVRHLRRRRGNESHAHRKPTGARNVGGPTGLRSVCSTSPRKHQYPRIFENLS